MSRLSLIAICLLVGPESSHADDQALVYTVSFPEAEQHYANIELHVPTADRSQLELMLPVWTPGSYLVREFARHIDRVSARRQTGEPLEVRKTRKNRWTIDTGGAAAVVVSYRLYCHEMTVRTNWVDREFAILNGAPTFLTPTDSRDREHIVRLQRPPNWKQAISPLKRRSGEADTWVASSFDELVDSPILAGNPETHEMEIGGRPHLLVNQGGAEFWDIRAAAADVRKVVAEHQRMWGTVPYPRYVFFNLITESGGGLEHDNSTVMMTSRWKYRVRREYARWLGLVSHEFFHSWNVRRLRPRPLVRYDYENENYTDSLWIAEGLTSYYDGLALVRAGLINRDEYLRQLSSDIRKLQKSPGRLVQSLREASYDTWIKAYRPDENSGNTRVSYYTKGAVVGFLLDAKIREITDGAADLDEVMRQMYARFSGDKGYTPDDFRETAATVAGNDLSLWFTDHIDSAFELDYTPALKWYGLEFAPAPRNSGKTPGRRPDAKPVWTGLEARAEDGRLVVSRITNGSPAASAGLNTGDEIIAVDGFRVGSGWTDRLKQFEPGQTVNVLIARRQVVEERKLTLTAPPTDTWKLKVRGKATPAQQQHLKAWLRLK